MPFERAVARWASAPIATGQPRSAFRPLVFGPRLIPWVTDVEQAASRPELAVLSALAHGMEAGAEEVGRAAVLAAQGLDAERAEVYRDVVMAALNEAARKVLEAQMHIENWEPQSETFKAWGARLRERALAEGMAKGKAEGEVKGKAEGKADALLRLLRARGIAAGDGERLRILACADVGQLDRWLDRALDVASAADLFR